ncbi:DUF4168 domain-containing protein [Brevundimonas sp.]|uniref:DUF4168 domain-containing protein n=1 Tax=Brevundimonas sp. TaxID=1871086 RepID=UPI002AB88BF4|nr:DUF4168 domain-containing protein [Brevundimonas sp.]MDZ4362129.1 DUF4168 domain-containing protein [Brevundimonas sp.]
MRLSTLLAATASIALISGTAVAAPVVMASPVSAAPQDAAFTDAELKGYATAMARITPIAQALNGATPNADQQAQMAAAVSESGLTIEKFNEISNAVGADPVLGARAELAAATPSPAGSVGAGVSDAEADQFGAAMTQLQAVLAAVQGGTPTPEQQAQMAAIVEGSGLSVERFNEISNAVAQDDHLRARVSLADARRN